MEVCEQRLRSRKGARLSLLPSLQGAALGLIESAHTVLGLVDFGRLPWALASLTFLAFGALRCHGEWGLGNGYVLMGDHEHFYPETALGWMAKLEEDWTVSEELCHMTEGGDKI